jgi:hypothetical protein
VNLHVQSFGHITNPSAVGNALRPLTSPGLPNDEIATEVMEID